MLWDTWRKGSQIHEYSFQCTSRRGSWGVQCFFLHSAEGDTQGGKSPKQDLCVEQGPGVRTDSALHLSLLAYLTTYPRLIVTSIYSSGVHGLFTVPTTNNRMVQQQQSHSGSWSCHQLHLSRGQHVTSAALDLAACSSPLERHP